MKIKTRWVAVFVFAFSFLVCQQVKAASIAGKVVEVNEGDEITIFNLNRNVRIKLMAIDAPEKDQAFGAAAKQHLFDLVNDKFVSVEYQGVGQRSILIGRVLADGNDICAQMVRDGAAWFDASNQNLLTQEQRDIYYQSEQAARSEKRGLWQSGDAVAPWEFVKAQELKKASTPTAVVTSGNLNEPPKHSRPVAELTSMGLLRTSGGVARPLASLENMSWADGSISRSWRKFQASGENFSVMVPDGGKEAEQELSYDGRTLKTSYYAVIDGTSVYHVAWLKVPSVGETDAVAMQNMVRGFLAGLNESLGALSHSFECEASDSRNISSGGFMGREYELTGCPAPGIVRIYTKSMGDQRSFLSAVVFFKDETENVQRFLKSVSVGASKSEVKKTKTAQ